MIISDQKICLKNKLIDIDCCCDVIYIGNMQETEVNYYYSGNDGKINDIENFIMP